MAQTTYLIVEPQAKAADDLSQFLKQLNQKHQLDIYQSRQRLIGKSLTLFSKGPREQQEKISEHLLAANFTHWLIEPTKPKFAPSRLRGLEIETDKIIFTCQKKRVEFAKGSAILAVFAEMSGRLAEQSVKQLLSSHAYRGRDDIRHLTESKTYKTILQGQPILDLYLLDQQKQIVAAVRVIPGKFDHKGLGELATASSKQNLDRLLKLVEKYAGDFHLATDFGLANLPGCTLRQGDPNDPDLQKKNLISLARYGWLLADLQRVGEIGQSETDDDDNLTGNVAAAILHQNPALLTGENLEQVMPVAREIAKEIEAADPPPKPEKEIDTADPGLPPPPPSKKIGLHTKPFFWIGSAGIGLPLFLIFFSGMEDVILHSFGRYLFSTGAFSLLFAGLFFWGGFHFVRLKRQVENTPTSKVRSVAMGMVEVKGRALRQYALISPMSHVPCVYYRLTKYHREDNKQWSVTSISSSDNVPFTLADDTGRISIDPAGCRLSAGTRQEGAPGQAGLTRFVDSNDKWVEEIVVEGTLLYVLGFASVKRDASPTLSEKKIEALRELKRNPQSLQQFDADGDGKISEDEWDAAREAVSDKVLRDELKKKQRRKKQEEHVVIGKKKGRPLVIAETHCEEKLTSRFALYSIPLFIGAAAATGFGIYQLINFLR